MSGISQELSQSLDCGLCASPHKPLVREDQYENAADRRKQVATER